MTSFEKNKKVKLTYSIFSNGKHRAITDMAAPYYPDYDPELDSRPLVNHYNQLMVTGVEANRLFSKTKMWNIGVIFEVDLYKQYDFVDTKLNKREESFVIYELKNS